ncbi:MAG: M81 family metallopeptidase [Spirochaetales bacterium]|nr:M81 family metallopeptidase [Spirochaetales bacterium]
MKILVAELNQESNSFCPTRTSLDDFRRYGICFGEEYRENVRGIRIEAEGIFNALEEYGIDYVPAIRMRAQAGSMTLPEVYDFFVSNIDRIVKEQGPFDGAVLSLHGASQSTERDDVCGDAVAFIRDLLGSDAVISASYDLHANITRKIFDNSDFVCGYQTYPHVDFYETGFRAASLAAMKLLGKKHDHMAWCSVPMIEPASGYSTEKEPLHSIMARARKMVEDGIISDFSMFQMQPWLDVSEGGSAVVTIGPSSEECRKCAEILANEVKSIRAHMSPKLYSFDEVIEAGERNESGKPVICVDFSDSANAGAAGDNSDVLARMIELGKDYDAAFIVLDCPAVDKAFEVGVGNTATFSLGGTLDPVCSKPLVVEAKVKSLHDGDFKLEGPSRGIIRHIGTCALLGIGKIHVLVTRSMASTGDPQLYRHFGVEPTLYKLVMVKANTSFYAGYGEICSDIMFTDTCCAATANLKGLPFRRLPRYFYPFEEIEDFDVKANTFVK